MRYFFLCSFFVACSQKQIQVEAPQQSKFEVVDNHSNQLEFLNEEVSRLKTRLSEKEIQLNDLDVSLQKEIKNRKELEKKAALLQKEVTILKNDLELLTKEHDALNIRLTSTLEKLDNQIVMTDIYRTKSKQYQLESIENQCFS